MIEGLSVGNEKKPKKNVVFCAIIKNFIYICRYEEGYSK